MTLLHNSPLQSNLTITMDDFHFPPAGILLDLCVLPVRQSPDLDLVKTGENTEVTACPCTLPDGTVKRVNDLMLTVLSSINPLVPDSVSIFYASLKHSIIKL